MKNLKLLGFLMIVASSFMFIQCTSDPIAGPQGIAGVDGVDGVDGVNGVDGTATCVACHSASHRDPIDSSYLLSGHKAGGAVGYAGGRGSCSRCHSNEGYINYITGKPAVNIANPTAISCTTCHEKHSTFDFETDGYDYALRSFEPVTLITDDTYTIDLGDKSNNCINCHQSRRTGPTENTDGEFFQNSGHWGPHHGPQAQFFEGIEVALISGSVGYPGVASSAHRTGSSCVQCHMGETTDGTDGAHSWLPTENTCTQCHSNGAPSSDFLQADMAALETLLEEAIGWEYVYSIERDVNGDAVLDADGDLQFLDKDGVVTTESKEYVILTDTDGVTKLTQEFVGILHGGHPATGFYGMGATWPIVTAEAAWNYLYVLEDASKGVHNPELAEAMIKNSIEALQ
jgi:hypothetical protein